MEKTKISTAERLAKKNAKRAKTETILIVGLGNVGDEYRNTRHNAGFMLVDTIQQAWNFVDWKEEKRLKAIVSKGKWEEGSDVFDVILAKPTTFMNLSGESVVLLMNFYKIDPKNLWIIHDDLDLPLGKIRLRVEGSAGTHNGMKSILTHMPMNTFPRLRIGIESRGEDHPYGLPKQMDTSAFVLSHFTSKENGVLDKTLDKAQQAIELAIKNSMLVAMNEFNR